jgi:hypothetical protein
MLTKECIPAHLSKKKRKRPFVPQDDKNKQYATILLIIEKEKK